MDRPKIIVFASGTKDEGGSGFENLVEASKSGILEAEIVAVVSNHEHGGVCKRAERLGIPFIYFNSYSSSYSQILKNLRIDGGRTEAEMYARIVKESGAEWVALSGWLKVVNGLDSKRTFNIHPALLSQLGGHGRAGRFGGKGMYGTCLYEAVKTALDAGEISESGFTMHFVTDELDRGPAFFEYRIPLRKGMKADDIEKAVHAAEHEWQPKITNMVVHGEISWDGKNPKSLVVPEGYQYLPKRK
ncbi:MAG: formyltransferase family protein [bacterium]|nr:formyltransferase family protein [bacterium]